jgi:hypothetical protein
MEGQRGGETEMWNRQIKRHRNRGTERWRNLETEKPRDRETEKQTARQVSICFIHHNLIKSVN